MPVATPFTLTWTGTALDTTVIAFSLDQAEGDFATLSIQIKNPRVGLLSGNLWATLAYNGDPIFYGRLVGVPSDLQAEILTLVFVAKPDDYDARREAVAAPLRVLPWYDPAFLPPERLLDPDAVLDARPMLWHTDRVTHAVTLSSIVAGEAGTVDIPLAFYDSVKIDLGEPPVSEVRFTMNIAWQQAGKGQIDLTAALIEAFTAANSYREGQFVSLTATGLLADWPQPGTRIGGGWEVGASSARPGKEFALYTVGLQTGGFGDDANGGVPLWGGIVRQWYDIEYGGGLGGDPSASESGDPTPTGYAAYDDGQGWYYDNRGTLSSGPITVPAPWLTGHSWGSWTPLLPSWVKYDPAYKGAASVAGFPILGITGRMQAKFDIARGRQETIVGAVRAQLQPVISESVKPMTFDLSAQVDQAIETTGQIPIGDVRRASYALTARGQKSIEHALLRARARLLYSARAVRVGFETTFDIGLTLTLRHSVRLPDPRLPAGSVTGKVVGLSLSLDGNSGRAVAAVTLGCMVGDGAAGGFASSPADPIAYAEPGYSAEFIGTGAVLTVGPDLQMVMPDPAGLDDDGIDLSAITAESAVLSCVVVNGLDVQKAALDAAVHEDSNAAIVALNEMPTTVQLTLKPLTKEGGFHSTFNLNVSQLAVPKDIDLSAGGSL